jgi:site-specific DNA-methyltransferase (adenine-specific)
MRHKINHANIKDLASNYDGELFDGILCDPPYELGFMGKSWDSSGIAFDTEMWADLFNLLKPGAHLLAFSGSRTYHRMAVAIEDAGFEIRDMIEWVYGSGFPKSLNIGKAVDKIQGNKREVVGTEKIDIGMQGGSMHSGRSVNVVDRDVTKGNSEWEGYGTALKPAHEPCVLARKPLEGTVANNVLKWGTGGLNIDGTRIPTGANDDPRLGGKGEWHIKREQSDMTVSLPPATMGSSTLGRFPANLIHDGSDEVEAVFPNESSRFFYTAKASKSERNAGLEGFEKKEVPQQYGLAQGETAQQTPHKNEPRANHHPTVKPLSLTKYLATLIKPPTGGRLLVPFSGSGSEMIGALQAGWEYVEGVELTEEYIPIAEARIAYWLKQPNQEKLL